MGPKPWKDKDGVPYQGDGDVDGDDNGTYGTDPGEERRVVPDAGDAENIVDL